MPSFERLLSSWRVRILIAAVALSIIVLLMQPLEKGFDLQGGARAVLKLGTDVDSERAKQLVSILQERLNIYGLKDIKVRGATDQSGTTYAIVEAAGLTDEDVRELLAKQGKFEAKINNETVFLGSDILVETFNSGIRYENGNYKFVVQLRITNPAASQKFAQVTKSLAPKFSLTGPSDRAYLNATLDLYMDDAQADTLRIPQDMAGQIIDSPVIEGFGESRADALKKMERMQAVLQTGALPTKLEVTSVERISPKLGAAFLSNTFVAGLLAILAVGAILFFRYRTFDIVFPVMLTGLSEITIILGVASLIHWQIDLPTIAGIIVSVGTGVNQQIIMTDEIRTSGKNEEDTVGIKDRIKTAMFIIFSAFGTTVAAMIPLMVIGFGAVRGFAITTIIGLSVGILVTRPAYLKVAQLLADENRI